MAWSIKMTNDLNIFMVTCSQSNELDQTDPLITSHCIVTQQWPCPGPRVGSGSELEPERRETFTHLTHHIIIELRLSPRSKARCLDSPCIVSPVPALSPSYHWAVTCYVIITSSSSPPTAASGAAPCHSSRAHIAEFHLIENVHRYTLYSHWELCH